MMTRLEILNTILAHHPAMPPLKRAYGEHVSKYLVAGVDRLDSPDTGEILLLLKTRELFDRGREIWGHPIPVTAGFRTLAHQDKLTELGYKTAKFISPHSVGTALDLDARANTMMSEQAVCLGILACMRQAAKDLGLPKPRFGHMAYGNKFLHMDLVFLLFAPYTELPHPSEWIEVDQAVRNGFASWREGVEW